MTWFRRVVPPFITTAILAVHTLLMYRAALKHTHGVVSYPVDDTFIHLALAKHLALDGVYGVTGRQFAAASSSVGWPFLLAGAIKIAGPQPWLPLLLNGLFGIALVVVIDVSVRRLGVVSMLARTLIGVAVVEFTPLPTLLVLGMEHTAHTAANVALIAAGALWLADKEERPAFHRTVFLIAALAFNTSVWRYEGAFPTFILAVLAVFRGRARAGALILAAGAVPATAFGLYAKAKGSLFLPVPVVLKGRHLDEKLGDLLGIDLMDRLGAEGAILAVAVGCAVVLLLVLRQRGFWSPIALTLTTTLAVFLLHLNFASIGWFYRYESYLLATGLTFAIAGLASLLPEPRSLWNAARREPTIFVGSLAIVFLFLPLRKRAIVANNDTPIACRNIFEQQMQSGRFLARFHTPVAVNDLGAVAWLGDEPVIDLVGLANLPIARAKNLKLAQPLKTADVARFTSDAQVAIIYDEWFAEPLPPQWLRVARWRIEDNRTCATPVVSIYATNVLAYPEVIRELRAFSPELPPKVAASGRYRLHPHEKGRVRPGDQIIVANGARELVGSYYVDDEGRIYLPKNKPVGVTVDGATSGELASRFASVPGANRPNTQFSFAASHRPRVTVVSGAGNPVESPSMTLDEAIAFVGGHDSPLVWVWRERDDSTFVKIARSDLGEGAPLEDGDIVVLP